MQDSSSTPPDREAPKDLSDLYPRATAGIAADDDMRNYKPSKILERSFRNPENAKRLKRLLIGADITLAILVLTVAMPKFFAGTGHPHAYAVETVQGSPAYSVSFDKSAQLTSRNGGSFLKGKDLAGQQTLYIQVASASQHKADCQDNIDQGGTTKIISSQMVNGEMHSLCYAGSVNSYQANFLNDGRWYYVAVIPEDRAAAVDLHTVEHIVRSVTIE